MCPGWRQGLEVHACTFPIEMSGLIEKEMPSFGVYSLEVERATLSEGGDAELEYQGW